MIHRDYKCVLFLSRSTMSYQVLKHLLETKCSITAIVLHGAKPNQIGGIPLFQEKLEAIDQLAHKHQIEIFFVENQFSNALYTSLTKLRPQVFLSACFPIKIPASIRRIPQHACVNLHPSALPAYKGPHPLFWQLRHGKEEIGLTLHKTIEQLDSGHIWEQSLVKLSCGLNYDAINQQIGKISAPMIMRFLQNLESKTPLAQNGTHSYYSTPKDQDFHLSLEWSAAHAFNFMCATAHWGHSYELIVEGHTINLQQALSFDPDNHLGKAWVSRGELITIQFAKGTLSALGHIHKQD